MNSRNEAKVHRLVLTGGPCSGKTTALTRLSEFFENNGWKVFRVPESAGIIIGCGISFYDLNEAQVEQIEEDIIKSILALEAACLNMAQLWNKPCIVVCDRGFMDCRAYLDEEMWRRILKKCEWNNIDYRDNRYDQVIHMVSSANGAQQFYECSQIRTEGIETALKLDKLTSEAWVGHHNITIIDNSTGFEDKINRLIHSVCKQIGVKSNHNFNLRKVKYLIKSIPNDKNVFPRFEDFNVFEDFDLQRKQTLKKRGQNSDWTYQMCYQIGDSMSTSGDQIITREEYERSFKQIEKRRRVSYNERCFIWDNTYFRLYIFKEKLQGVIVLETETSLSDQIITTKVPPFLQINKRINDDKQEFSFQGLTIENSINIHHKFY